MTEPLKFLNSLKIFGALAECPEFLKAFSRSITVFTLSLSFVTLCRRFARRFNSPSIRCQCELGLNEMCKLSQQCYQKPPFSSVVDASISHIIFCIINRTDYHSCTMTSNDFGNNRNILFFVASMAVVCNYFC